MGLACFMEGFGADGMLITEPSDLCLVTAHNGVKYFRVRVVGKTAHAALSHTGVNAIGKLNKIYDAMVELDERRAAEPLVQDSTHPFLRAFLDSSRSVPGREPEEVVFPGGLDTRFSPYFGIPSFVFGPRGGNIHGPDEYLEIDSLMTPTRVVAKFVLDWCGYC